MTNHLKTICTSLLLGGGTLMLSACSNMPTKPSAPERHFMKKQFDHVCKDQEVGKPIEVKIGDRVMQGTCELHFKPSKPYPPKPE